MVELSKKGYSKQLVLYLNNKDYQKAYELGKEFTTRFPEDLMANFLFSKAAFWFGDYETAAKAGRKAFNLATTEDDMLFCAIVTSSAYYNLDQYAKGYELLRIVEGRQTSEDLERMLFIFSLAMKDPEEAVRHVDELYKLNKKAAEELIVKYLEE